MRHGPSGSAGRCVAWGGWYRLPPGVERRLDGKAQLSAIGYEVEKRRCAACGHVCTAPLPPVAGAVQYSPRAVIVLGRYGLWVPLYRLEAYHALLEVPVAEATQWDRIERVADCAYPVFAHLQHLAAQGEVLYQDDTHVRILSRIAEHRQAGREASETSAKTE